MITELTAQEQEKAAGLKVWIVWYEDRFGWGPDRDPASPVAAFLTEEEAEKDVMTRGGPPDSPSGKFDGYFVQDRELLRAVQRNVVKISRARELLQQV